MLVTVSTDHWLAASCQTINWEFVTFGFKISKNVQFYQISQICFPHITSNHVFKSVQTKLKIIPTANYISMWMSHSIVYISACTFSCNYKIMSGMERYSHFKPEIQICDKEFRTTWLYLQRRFPQYFSWNFGIRENSQTIRIFEIQILIPHCRPLAAYWLSIKPYTDWMMALNTQTAATLVGHRPMHPNQDQFCTPCSVTTTYCHKLLS